MDKNVKEKGGSLFLYMITAARLLYAQKWKNEIIPTVNEWIIKMMELAEMATLTTIIKEGSATKFIVDWKHFVEFVQEIEKNDIYVSGFVI